MRCLNRRGERVYVGAKSLDILGAQDLVLPLGINSGFQQGEEVIRTGARHRRISRAANLSRAGSSLAPQPLICLKGGQGAQIPGVANYVSRRRITREEKVKLDHQPARKLFVGRLDER